MDRKQAEQLAKRIRNEAPYLIVSVELVTSIVGQNWAVRIIARSTGLFLGIMESPTAWNELKPYLLKKLPPNS